MPWNGSWIFILIAFVRLLPAMHYHVIPQRTWIKKCAIAMAALHCNYTDHNCTWFSLGSLWIHLMFAHFHIITTIFDSNMLRILLRSQQLLICTHTGHSHIWFQNALIPCELWALVCCLIWNGMNHLSNSFMLWLFVGSDTSIRCWFVVTNIYISLDWFSHGPTYDKIGLCCSWFSKFDNSTFLSIDFLMIRPTTKLASAVPDFQNLIRVHFFGLILWWSNLRQNRPLLFPIVKIW